jgi:hypothetical protein
MRTIATTLLYGLFLTIHTAGAATIAGHDIADRIELAGSGDMLVLNGAGVREKFFMDIYIGALYLPAATSDSRAILSDSGPASVRMFFLHKEVSKKKIVTGWQEGLAENLSAGNMKALQPKLDKFNDLFRTMMRGDVVSIDYIPATGTEVRINNEWRGVVPGNDFYRALLKVWLGDKPVSKSLKQAMLGKH